MVAAGDNVGSSGVSILLFGPAGSGKTTIGKMVAERIGAEFADADDFHSPASVEKMRNGTALTDEDRAPWLARLAELLAQRRPRGLVLACSALKESYRRTLTSGADEVRQFYLKVPRDILAQRLRARSNHFAGADLLESQLETLEEPATGWVDATRSPEQISDEIVEKIHRR